MRFQTIARSTIGRLFLGGLGLGVAATAVVGVPAPAQALSGGTDAAPGQFPYLVNIPDTLCQAAMITSTWAVTTKYCVRDNLVGKSVEVGWTGSGAPAPITTTVSQVVTTPGTGDIALIRVEPRAGIQPIALADTRVAVNDTLLSVAGGERTSTWQGTRKLRSAAFRVTRVGQDTIQAVGATSGVANCLGDWGSPYIKETNDGPQLVGVTRTAECNNTIATSVQHVFNPAIRAWIDSVVAPTSSNFASAYVSNYGGIAEYGMSTRPAPDSIPDRSDAWTGPVAIGISPKGTDALDCNTVDVRYVSGNSDSLIFPTLRVDCAADRLVVSGEGGVPAGYSIWVSVRGTVNSTGTKEMGGYAWIQDLGWRDLTAARNF